MANKNHLKLLKQDTKVWNKWREQHPQVQPDLQNADLSEKGYLNTNLRGADLRGANLRNAEILHSDLRQANLRGANLRGGDFSNTNLSGAQFEKADLSFARFGGAILRRTDLSKIELSGVHLARADLREAILRDAHLDKANLSEAHLYKADLRGADLQEADLNGAQLSEADLSETTMTKVNLIGAHLRLAKLQKADLYRADLSGADLCGADLREAILEAATLYGVDLSRADLKGADLTRATLVGADLTETDLTNCRVYGLSVWDVHLEATKQDNLIITPKMQSYKQFLNTPTKQDNFYFTATFPYQPTITVDNLKIAQFIYLLLNNEEIRDVINTLTTKAVLILGRFTPERKAVLDALRDTLRKQNYVPILFDFDKPSTQTVRETVRTLAHLSHFIIADLTDPSSIPLELETIIPTLPIAVQPILAESQKKEFSMFSSLSTRYHWLLPIYHYADLDSLLVSLDEKVLSPAEQKAQELAQEI